MRTPAACACFVILAVMQGDPQKSEPTGEVFFLFYCSIFFCVGCGCIGCIFQTFHFLTGLITTPYWQFMSLYTIGRNFLHNG